MEISNCDQHFGFDDFDPDRVNRKGSTVCPIRGCSANLNKVSYRKHSLDFCPAHGLRLHSNTFVYWNGPEKRDEARLRNFRVQRDLAYRIALTSDAKAESHRLGYEMSEDALTWNVFVGLAEAQKLRHAVRYLTGRVVSMEPKLYLWGELIDVQTGKRGVYPPLDRVRNCLERDIKRFRTEPDVMLVADDHLLICIEAKFGSGNTLATDSNVAKDDKPKKQAELLHRYLGSASANARAIVDPNAIGKRFHSQLFRNIVFASEMAGSHAWHVVNLVSSTQWRRGRESKGSSYEEPTKDVQAYLRSSHKECFSFRTWEDLYRSLIKDDSTLRILDGYVRAKSAHFEPAFDLK